MYREEVHTPRLLMSFMIDTFSDPIFCVIIAKEIWYISLDSDHSLGAARFIKKPRNIQYVREIKWQINYTWNVIPELPEI